ncbi:hypothetical protein QT972_00090 [Microcoleus sp. herbarium7]|uniref:hypothetical protein n=1 Tax=Microcoleus sp. herbarium7 TaxID=3055435 RepID=UPI002FD2BE4A
MLPLHTQKSLDVLTWNEIQKLHSSLGLKATAATRSRRDYQRRIVAAQPHPVVEAEQVATALTCAACPFAILLEDNRYECGAGVTSAVTRGHWEAKSDCYDAVAQAQTEVTEPTAEVETLIALTTEEICTTLATVTQEVVTSIPAPKSHSCSVPVLGRVKLKQPPIWVYVPPSQVPETIVWETPFKGETLGKNEYRPFFVDNDCIYVVLKSRTNTFYVGEFSNPNYHHKVIRQAIEAGKNFDAASSKQRANARGCPSPKYQTYWWKDVDGRSCNLGELYQNCDGWWWAWASQGDREGCKFQTQIQAQKYLETGRKVAIARQTEIAALV